jgi:hypothetical protein
MKKQSAILLMLLASTLAAPGQSAPQIAFWKEALTHDSLEGIAGKIRDAKNPGWPRIESELASKNLPAKEQALQATFADMIREKLSRSFKADQQLSKEEMRKEVATLATIADAMQRARGFRNLVLQDSVVRLTILRMAQWLTAHPTDGADLEETFAQVNAAPVHLQAMLNELWKDDPALADKAAVTSGIDDRQTIFQALAPIGLNSAQVMEFTNPDLTKTSALLHDASAPALIYRMATTEALKWVHLRGAIQYFKAGGSFAELNPADIRPFTRRMGKEASSYNYPLLGIRAAGVDQILALVRLGKDDAQERAFLEVVLK